jgi:nucleotide-binding universal stress UspA family protein
MKILIAIDGSGYSERAVKYLTSHADLLGSAPQLHLLHVQPSLPPHAASHLPRASADTYYGDEAAKALDPARAALAKAGIPFTDGYVVGDPAEQLVAVADKEGYDMLVMGSHGHGLFTSVALGSTVTKVLSGCKVPVLIIR